MQSRAARALLGLTQADLAAQSGVSLRTIANFESGEHQPIPTISAAIQHALESAGIIFLDEDRAGGPGVRLANRRRSR
jgi:transcriptional regulator with XRE-family HTH domain